MVISFIKAEALGNDFVIIESSPFSSEQVRCIANRRSGIGCDQVIFFQRLPNQASVDVQFYNADGTEAEACGNGSRALVVLLGQGNEALSITMRTKTRDLLCEYFQGKATVNMGHATISTVKAAFLDGQIGAWGSVDVGNPHLIAFVNDLDVIDIESIGPELEYHPDFANRVNVSVAEKQADRIRLRTWERGAGYTGACGTAACATAALAQDRGIIQGQIIVSQSGGDLSVSVAQTGIQMCGPARIVFKGEIDLL